MRRFQAGAEIEDAGLMRDPLNAHAIGAAREVAIPMNDMSVGRTRLVSSQRQAGDEGADAHLPMRIDIGHLSHDEMPALLQDEVAFIAQPLEVWITTEQCE